MSLFKQLWLSIILLFIVVFTSCVVVNSLSAKRYLEQQLYLKNTDNAAALALALSQQDADKVLLDLTLAAQFDTGHYQLISIRDPEGKIIAERRDEVAVAGAPRWFADLLPITAAPGIAQVQQGWQQLGTLTVVSHSRFAYQQLWNNTRWLVLVFLVATVFAGSLGSYLLKRLLRPLNDVVVQAEAIGNRRFISIPEPATTEFRRVVAAMNTLSGRIQVLLKQEAGRMDKWRRESQLDKVTGLTNREHFMKLLVAGLERDDASASGVLFMVRLSGLARLNQVYGHKAVDGSLAAIGAALNRVIMQDSSWTASRLNGSDFAMMAPRASDAMSTARQVHDALRETLTTRGMIAEISLPGACTLFGPDDAVSELLKRLDGALMGSEQEGESTISVTNKGDFQIMPVREQMGQWRTVLTRAFKEQKFSLASFPVTDLQGGLLHMECPARLSWRDELLTAGQFLPWINRLELAGDLDKQVVDLALGQIEFSGKPVCINLSVAAITEPSFLMWISERFSTHSAVTKKLSMELAENVVYRYLESFRKLCHRAGEFGCQIGIEHMGHQLADIGALHDIGVDYFKLDGALVRDIDHNSANQTLLRTLCTVGHSIGVTVIAEGVQTEFEWKTLAELGVDGVTGPAVTARHKTAA